MGSIAIWNIVQYEVAIWSMLHMKNIFLRYCTIWSGAVWSMKIRYTTVWSILQYEVLQFEVLDNMKYYDLVVNTDDYGKKLFKALCQNM